MFDGGLVCSLATAALAATPLAQEQPAGQPAAAPPPAAAADDPRTRKLKGEAVAEVERLQTFTQQMVDSIFSFGELGFQEIETNAT